MNVGKSDIKLAASAGKGRHGYRYACATHLGSGRRTVSFGCGGEGFAKRVDQAVKAEASIKGVALPPTLPAIGSTPFQIDSLVVVSILCVVEPILGIELPDSVVRTGGYGSVDQALTQLLPRIEACWKKRKGGK